MGKKSKEYNKVRPIRLSDETWKNILERKQEGKSWNLFFEELFNAIDNISKFKK